MHESGKTKWEYQHQVMDKIKDKFGHKSVAFGYLDANCHDELFMPLDIAEDYLPNYISYSSSKKQ